MTERSYADRADGATNFDPEAQSDADAERRIAKQRAGQNCGHAQREPSEAAAELIAALNDIEISAYNAAKYRIGKVVAMLTDGVPAERASTNEDTERKAFIDAHHQYLDLTEANDAWGRPIFKHTHIQAMWEGWRKRAGIGGQR